MNKTRSAIRNYIEWLPKQSIWIFIFHLPILFLLYVVSLIINIFKGDK